MQAFKSQFENPPTIHCCEDSGLETVGKPWRPLLLIALAETELPAADGDSDLPSPRRSHSGRNRNRRGGRGASGPMDLLPKH